MVSCPAQHGQARQPTLRNTTNPAWGCLARLVAGTRSALLHHAHHNIALEGLGRLSTDGSGEQGQPRSPAACSGLAGLPRTCCLAQCLLKQCKTTQIRHCPRQAHPPSRSSSPGGRSTCRPSPQAHWLPLLGACALLHRRRAAPAVPHECLQLLCGDRAPNAAQAVLVLLHQLLIGALAGPGTCRHP